MNIIIITAVINNSKYYARYSRILVNIMKWLFS